MPCMTEAQIFLAEIESFLVRTGMSASAFGRLSMRDKNFVPRLRAGGQVWLDTAGTIRKFMADYQADRKKRMAA